ncbi:SRPBCC family protein [Schumannella sp. 10F1B-5-1]|uniref:SRPBCC family protein n=1 Tax=Schumannella sp. 10F1B-5-1 TaxID=2590780 RepID=UPI001130262C|nr:SRPBCC family protein [Schumannella sp. 10F1B-5-1]TPW70751.1 polyketide cyclase [Schumannella sp. 10F1B-5-1]
MTALRVTAAPDSPIDEAEREFDAPVEALFRAHVDPEVFARWVGPAGYVTTTPVWEPRSGGSWRFVQSPGDGDEEYAFRGMFHTVRENELILQTFEFEGAPDQVAIETYRFSALEGGRSVLRTHSVFASVEARDGFVEEGMEQGMREGYEKLDAVLAEVDSGS